MLLDHENLLQSEAAQMRAAADAYIAGTMSEEDFRAFRMLRGVYNQRQPNVFIMRFRLPDGQVTSTQLRSIAQVAQRYSDGRAHLTTRSAVQFYYVKPENVADVMDRMAEVGLSTRESTGPTLRSVTACPKSGFCPTQRFDVVPYAHAITHQFLRSDLVQKLPRKVKVALSGCADDCAMAGANCIGLIANIVDGVNGFRVVLGGGLGAAPKLATELYSFVPGDEVAPLIEAILRMFAKHGDYEHRSKARMKFLIGELGIQKMRELIEAERAEIKHTPGKVSSERTAKQAVTLQVAGGDLSCAQLTALADSIEAHGEGWARCTIDQNLLIPTDAPDSLRTALAAVDLSDMYTGAISDIVSCPGAATCRMALTRSKSAAQELAKALQPIAHLPELVGADIRISGCPNSCGLHHVATIGLHGVALTVGQQRVPGYSVFIGGSHLNGIQFAKPIGRFAARRVERLILRLLELRDKNQPNVCLTDYLNEVDIDWLKAQVADLATIVPSPEEADSFAIDLGDDKPYALKSV